jgi:hypothetical protein
MLDAVWKCVVALQTKLSRLGVGLVGCSHSVAWNAIKTAIKGQRPAAQRASWTHPGRKLACVEEVLLDVVHKHLTC